MKRERGRPRKMENEKTEKCTAMRISAAINEEFRDTCVASRLKPKPTVESLLKEWIENRKRELKPDEIVKRFVG